MKHTPTPWIASREGRSLVEWYDEQEDFYNTVADCSQSYTLSDAEADANAAHIVHCVNSHDELVAALKESLRVMRDPDCDVFDVSKLEDQFSQLLEKVTK